MTKGRVGLVQGSWDLFHIGHLRYLQKAREVCDYLVVGVDSDEKIRKRKGPNRPIIPYEERAEFIRLLRIADRIVEKPVEKQKWALIKEIRPSVLIATEGNYTPEEIKQLLNGYCSDVYVLPRQATTSTSHRIREVLVKNNGTFSVARTPDNVHPVYAKALVNGKWYYGRNLVDSTLFPEEIINRTELYYATVEHAEINCLKQFKDHPDKFAVTLIPCERCLKALAMHGIKEVLYVEDSDRNWAHRGREKAKQLGVCLTHISQEKYDTLDC